MMKIAQLPMPTSVLNVPPGKVSIVCLVFVTFLSVLIDPSGVTATTSEAEEQDSSSGDESTMQ